MPSEPQNDCYFEVSRDQKSFSITDFLEVPLESVIWEFNVKHNHKCSRFSKDMPLFTRLGVEDFSAAEKCN